ncbi:molybdenum cofactor guanylyltransferase [Aureispira sp. CCB-E]|uniref:molybdenum cofactor guanylyltransferase n=1 Tax=Aureispira sp. CCB-E TaxID=3051121 RepID=UPI002869214A|nr:molybdenum cofactor guanylyltransferase [Aureispira sp. CCB-E]WMX16773.1 molybdenum cofactor guanylyltransferase [Aureispira sp. CCB-E]
MIAKDKITTVILAGGKSRRMGEDKAFLDFNGQTFLEHILENAKGLTAETMIIGDPQKYSTFGVEVYSDVVMGKGPVGGIYTAMTIVPTPYLLVLSCDVPLLRRELLAYLIQNSMVNKMNLLTLEDVWQPLTAIYCKEQLPIFENALNANQLRLRTVLSSLQLNKIQCPKNWEFCLSNINTPIDLKKIRNGYRN